MTHEHQLYTTCEAQSAIGLIAEIDKKVRSLTDLYQEVTVQSVSHDVFTQPSGLFLWSALIVANVKEKKEHVEKDNEG